MLYIQNENDEWVTQDMLVPHIKTYIIYKAEESVENIKALSLTSETEEKIVETSLKLHEFILDKYKTDYIALAELIDNDAPELEIQQAIEKFDEENLKKYWDLHTKLMDIAIPYAESNGIEVSRY